MGKMEKNIHCSPHYIELFKSEINILNNVLEECFNPKLYTVIKVIDI